VTPDTTLLVLTLTSGAVGALTFYLMRRLGREQAQRRTDRAQLDTLFEYAPTGLVLIRDNGSIGRINRHARQLLGYSSAQVARLDDWWAKAFPEDALRSRAIETARRMTEDSRQNGRDSGPEEFRIRCGDGTDKEIEFHYVALAGGGLWAFNDVTDQRRLAEATRLANDHMLAQLGENQRLQEALREQSIRDPLTQAFNRRYLDETLEREIARAKRERQPLTVAMIDIDHFKRLNDTYGHLAGDQVLVALTGLLRGNARQEDVVCRFGGEEFAVILPGMPLDIGCRRVDDWRRAFAATPTRFGEQRLEATFSAGVAVYPDHGTTSQSLIDAADQALYRAKQGGRDRVEAAAASAAAAD